MADYPIIKLVLLIFKQSLKNFQYIFQNNIFDYNVLTENIEDYTPELTIPDPYFLQPNQEDYDNGFVKRYFYKRKGSTTINEIDKTGFSALSALCITMEICFHRNLIISDGEAVMIS